MMQQRRTQIRRDGGRFSGFRVNCEQVPMLPARAIRQVLDDPRKIPYLLVWKDWKRGKVTEAVRVIARSAGGPLPCTDKVELKRTDGSVVVLCLVWRRLPRGNGRTLLFSCPNCSRQCRALYGAKVGDDGHFYVVRRANWECRTCAQLRYSSEGGALLFWPGAKWAARLGMTGPVSSPRPNP